MRSPARRGGTGLRSNYLARHRPGEDPSVVQGGRLAKILTPRAANREFWPVDKVILFYFVLSFIPIVGWWGRIPDAWFYFTWHVVGIALLLLEVKVPNPTSW